jgi:hypothetical protein
MKEFYEIYMLKYSAISDEHKQSKLKELPMAKDEPTLQQQTNALIYCIDREILMENTPYLYLWGIKDVDKPTNEGLIDGETYY